MAATDRYWGRLAVYLICAAAGSACGTAFTWWSSTWSDANPLTDGLRAALFSLGPAIAVAAAARLRRVEVAAVGACLAIAMVAMWGLFASSDSSTSGLVFLWGWFAGLPASGVLLVVATRRTQTRRWARPPVVDG